MSNKGTPEKNWFTKSKGKSKNGNVFQTQKRTQTPHTDTVSF
jgi:hypothetical protein